MKASLRLSLTVLLVTAGLFTPRLEAAIPTERLEGLEWRLVGPWRGGRVTAVTGVRGQPNLYYKGAPVTGGQLERLADLQAEWRQRRDELQAIAAEHIQPINDWARQRGVAHVAAPGR